ncbi:WRKY DNA-binding transcription factor 70-like [Primulina tabacum]|uniref:WRKY DNA-binding transcription factor 70-like n=1 Tax=Primulina tabacum TaxID=48773 RepID=UPI003F5A8664
MENSSENFNAMKKRLVEELIKGRESAFQLQTLLHKLAEDSGQEQLAMKILTSLTEGLLMVTLGTSSSAQIASVDCAGGGAAAGGDGGGRKKKTGVKDRRGCYKRKRTSDSWTEISPTTDDGRVWRKYGQKDILNCEYPRWYYRCTHKNQGCKATKQVQKIKEEPLLYQTTYFSHHTCTATPTQLAPELILESDPAESNLLSFGPNNHLYSSPNPVKISSSEEDKHMVCFPHSISSGPWPGIVEPESIESKQVWSPRILVSYDDLEEAVSGLYSCTSMTGSQHGLDTEVNQLVI